MRSAFFFMFMLLAKFAAAQDLTGIWRGSFNSSDKYFNQLSIEDRYKFEVQLDQTNKSLKGVTYSYKTTVFYGKAAASGTVNPKTGKVLIQELKIVEVKMNQNSYACVMVCFLQYSKNGDEEFLEGKYTSYRESDSTSCGKGTVFLRKVPTSDFYIEPFLARRFAEKNRKKPAIVKKITPPSSSTAKKPPVKSPAAKSPAAKSPSTTSPLVKKPAPKNPTAKSTAPPLRNNLNPSTKSPTKTPPKTATVKKTPAPSKPLKEAIPEITDTEKNQKYIPSIRDSKHSELPRPLATRENELIKTITLHSNEVTINLYDNGTIDHDTVSVYLDKKLVVSKQMLTTSPITVNFKLDDETASHELVMVAENLGDIPPNTSLMVVKAGDQQYEIRITSTEQKNAVVVFRYEKN